MRLASVAAVLVLLLYVQTNEAAQQVVTKQVDCSNKTISNAVSDLDNDKAYVIEVTGTCTENVLIANYTGPSLQIIGTPSAILNGVDSTPAASPFTISGARRVVISNFTVNPNTGLPSNPAGNIAGINMALCEGCSLNNVIVNATRLGILVNQTQGFFFNVTANVAGAGQGMAIIQSSDVNVQNFEATGNLSPMSFAALNVGGGSRVRLNYTTPKTIKNFLNGILVNGSASLEGPAGCGTPPLLTPCLTIRDNTFGMRVTSAQVLQMGGVEFDNNGDGIWAENASVLQLNPPVKITNSTGTGPAVGAGIILTHNSHASIFSFSTAMGAPANVIQGNLGRGIAVASGSTLQLNGSDLDNANQITGNGGDIACHTTSLVTGTNTVPPATVITCANNDPVSVPLP